MKPSKYSVGDHVTTRFQYLGKTEEITSLICPRSSYVDDLGVNKFILVNVANGVQIKATEAEIDAVLVSHRKAGV